VTTGEGRLETLALLRAYVAEGDVPVPLINWMRHVEWEIARLAEAADQMTEIAERAAAPSYSFRASGNIFDGEAVLTITDGTTSLAHPEGLTPDLPVQITLSRATVMRLRLAMLDRPQDEDWSGEVRQACKEIA
jgi:hypothetical protein